MPEGSTHTHTGRADRYAVIGHPIAHSRSPAIHAWFAKQTGERITYERIDAEPAAFEETVQAFRAAGGRGLNVTVPHKEAAFRLAREHGADALRAQAVNTLSFAERGPIRGDNTDGVGLLRDLTVNEAEPVAGRSVLILGAGGAARGIVGPLLDAAPQRLVIANRTRSRAEVLVASFTGHAVLESCGFEELAAAGPFDVVINATSIALTGEAPAFPDAIVGRDSFCYDLSYAQGETPFERWALARGARRAVQGWGMLIEQAAESFRIWRGRRPETRGLVEHLRSTEPL